MANTYSKIGRIRPDYADTWDASRSYTALEMVKSADSYHAYIAKQDVPAGTPLTNADYWGEVLDVGDVIAESVAATNRANTAAANADAAREGIQDDLNGLHDELRTKADGILCTAEGETITLTDASDDPMRGLVLFGKTTYDGEPSPENPVTLVNKGEKGSIEVTTAGKNLLPNTATSRTESGVTFVVNADGSVLINGVATDDIYYLVNAGNLLDFTGLEITATGGFPSLPLLMTDNINVENGYSDMGGGATFNGYPGMFVNIFVAAGAVISNQTVYPMIRLSSVADAAYEPYKGQHTLTALAPNGLPGIKVSSGGNYTDVDGQMWVCDEVDFERGVYVQSTAMTDLGALDWLSWWDEAENPFRAYAHLSTKAIGLSNMICESYANANVADTYLEHGKITGNKGNKFIYIKDARYTTFEEWKASISGVMLLYELATPVETPLPTEEIAAYRALHTNKPNTTIYNDEGAHMAVSYNADTKTYIDNKISELAAAIVNTNA